MHVVVGTALLSYQQRGHLHTVVRRPAGEALRWPVFQTTPAA
jgi:hypothetical protein